MELNLIAKTVAPRYGFVQVPALHDQTNILLIKKEYTQTPDILFLPEYFHGNWNYFIDMDILVKEFNLPEKEQFQFLSDFAKRHQPQTILEIGTGWGLSACAFLLNSNAVLTTIDPRENLEDFERRTKMVGVYDRITKITGRSGKNCTDRRHKSEKAFLLETFKQKFDLVYVDGSHEYEDVYYDIIHALELTNEFVLADDYFHKDNFGGSYGVAKAISQIAKLKNFSYIVHPVAHGMVQISL